MKGTDVTPEQLAHAEIFLQSAQVKESAAMSATGVVRMVVERADLARLLAWYGAIRAKNGNVQPGRLVSRASDMSASALESGAAQEFVTAPDKGIAGYPPPHPCHSRPKEQWCDHAGPGGFMGHTCKPTTTSGGLWRNNPATPEGKYLVKRRDGTIPEWPYFVIGAKDPAAPSGLRGYANKARALGMDEQYCNDVLGMAERFEEYRIDHGPGDPDGKRHRKDDPATIAEMRKGHSA